MGLRILMCYFLADSWKPQTIGWHEQPSQWGAGPMHSDGQVTTVDSRLQVSGSSRSMKSSKISLKIKKPYFGETSCILPGKGARLSTCHCSRAIIGICEFLQEQLFWISVQWLTSFVWHFIPLKPSFCSQEGIRKNLFSFLLHVLNWQTGRS